MANSMIQLRLDEDTKLKASSICSQLGIDLPTYMRICISRLISNNGIPFDMTLDSNKQTAFDVLLEMGKISKENGNFEMSLDEINREIGHSRSER